jgi:ferredoxin
MHFAEVPLKDFDKRALLTRYISGFSVFIGFVGLGIIIGRFKKSPDTQLIQQEKEGKNLLKFRWLRFFITSKYFRNIFIIPTLIIFLLIIFVGFFDVQDGKRNIATVYTWTLWWSLVIFSFVVAGRFWCMMCPFAFLGDLAQKIVSLNRKLPRWLQNMGFQTLAFVLLTIAFALFAFGSRPMVTASVILAILLSAVVFSMIYQRRSFCRHLCPVGAVIGIYSTVSPIELRACNEGSCIAHKKKECTIACPMLEAPHQMDNNIYCNFCMKCEPACPKSNLGLRLRTFGKDLYASLHKSSAEAVASLFILGIVVVETLAMTSSWPSLENTVRNMTGIDSPAVIFILLFTLVILLPVGIFYLFCFLLKLWLGKEEYKTQNLVTGFAFFAIPMGIALHLAHNIQHLFIEGPIAIPATIRFLQNIGIGKSMILNWNPAPLLGLEPIFIIQMSILITGFGFTLFILHRMLRRFHNLFKQAYKTAFVMGLYAIVVILSGIYMLGLPMNGRHIH